MNCIYILFVHGSHYDIKSQSFIKIDNNDLLTLEDTKFRVHFHFKWHWCKHHNNCSWPNDKPLQILKYSLKIHLQLLIYSYISCTFIISTPDKNIRFGLNHFLMSYFNTLQGDIRASPYYCGEESLVACENPTFTGWLLITMTANKVSSRKSDTSPVIRKQSSK